MFKCVTVNNQREEADSTELSVVSALVQVRIQDLVLVWSRISDLDVIIIIICFLKS